ncbi:hypothetical protein V2J09_004932 [Rumex salicifolius]
MSKVDYERVNLQSFGKQLRNSPKFSLLYPPLSFSLSVNKRRGLMEIKSARCLINSISRFILLGSCQTSKFMPIQKDFESMAVLMKHLKPYLDEVVDGINSLDVDLLNESEKLDIYINEAREYMEKWSPKASKILSVWQSELLLTRIRSSSLEICCILSRLLQESPSTLIGVHELESWQPNKLLKHIEQALKNQSGKSNSSAEDMVEIINSLGLKSNQELLKERITIEKERMKAENDQIKSGEDQIFQAVDLISLIQDYMLKSGYFDSCIGFSIPSYFRCPLSLEIMSDPVIVASGQTFERACIQKWISHGLKFCPVTSQPLSHTNLIPNHTIKAMIVTCFEENNSGLPGKSGVGRPASHGSSQDVIHTDSFHGSHHGSNSTSRSSNELIDVCAIQESDETSRFGKEDSSVCHTIEIQKAGSPGNSHTHIRTQCFSPSYSSKSITEMSESQNSNYIRTDSSSDFGSDETTTYPYVGKLVEDLKTQLAELQTSAAFELRLLAKHNTENRVIIGKCGAVGPLIELMYSDKKTTQEHAVTALLNLSLHKPNKAMIVESGALESLVHVLNSGNNTAKENSAASLFSLSLMEEHKLKIGRSGAIKALVNLLGKGLIRGKKDAIAALFNLSICHENRARIVLAGAVSYLVELLDKDSGLIDQAIALLANLATVSEGRATVVKEGGIPMVVEVLNCGSQRGKENAAFTLLQLCLNNDKFCSTVIQEGAVPPLVLLSQTGTPRAREKALQLLSCFRSQRENATTAKKRIIEL